MSYRDEPMYYDLEIEEIKTGEANQSQVGAWWSGDASMQGLRTMCDCQLAGYFYARPTKQRFNGKEEISWSNAFSAAQRAYLKENNCKHGPAKKFRPLRAHLPSGEAIELTEKAAA